jgi:hypothetical protein
MKPTHDALTTLQGELEFVNKGGYRALVGRRQPLFCMETGADWQKPVFIEDSPSCPKEKYCACNPEGDCVLLSFVPADQRHEKLPCHHIPLNAQGDTIASLEKSGNRGKVEAELKTWLTSKIEGLQPAVATKK